MKSSSIKLIFITLSILSVIPFFIICFLAFPIQDDIFFDYYLNHSTNATDLFSLDLFKAMIFGSNGRYFNAATISFNIVDAHNLLKMRIYLCALMSFLFYAYYYFCSKITNSKLDAILYSSLLFAFTIIQTPFIDESFYWYASATHNVLGIPLVLIYLGLFLDGFNTNLKFIIANILIFCLTGTNEIFLGLGLGMTFLGLIQNTDFKPFKTSRKHITLVITAILSTAFFFYLSTFSQWGRSVTGINFTLKAIIDSLMLSGKELTLSVVHQNFINGFLLFFLLLTILNRSSKNPFQNLTSLQKKLSILVILLILIGIFFIPIHTGFYIKAVRTQNVLYWLIPILLIITWLILNLKLNIIDSKYTSTLIALIFLFIIISNTRNKNTNNLKTIFSAWQSNEIQRTYTENSLRYQILNNDFKGGKLPVLNPKDGILFPQNKDTFKSFAEKHVRSIYSKNLIISEMPFEFFKVLYNIDYKKSTINNHITYTNSNYTLIELNDSLFQQKRYKLYLIYSNGDNKIEDLNLKNEKIFQFEKTKILQIQNIKKSDISKIILEN